MPTIFKPKKIHNRTGRTAFNDKHYQTAKWRKLRQDYFSKNPLCEDCLNPDIPNEDGSLGVKVKETEEIHHIQRICDAPELAFCWDNLAALCKYHHHQRHLMFKENNINNG